MKVKKYISNFITVMVALFLGFLIANYLLIQISSQKIFPRSLAGSLPNILLTFYPDTYKKNNSDSYVAILGDSYSQGGGDAYLNNKYDYSFGHHLHKNDNKNYLNFGRAGFGSISAVSNLIKINKLTNLPNTIKNLKKPESIIFFFYEGNDLEDNIFEYNSLIKTNESVDDFVIRRITQNSKVNFNDKISNLFPLSLLIKKLYGHTSELISKAFESNNVKEIGTLITKRLKKLFGKTIILNDEETNEFTYINSLKNNKKIKNIRPLQSAAVELSNEEILISLKIFFQSIKYLKSWGQIDKISIVYIPSPTTSYVWNDPIAYEAKDAKNGKLNNELKTTSNMENILKSSFIRERINRFSKSNDFNFVDTTELIIKETNKKILHGPLDWRHFNYEGYKSVSMYIKDNI